jgi:ABC-2 type transport system ATP-binding protein
MTQNAIVAENLVYRYGHLTAVDDISFAVAEGEILGFLGPNGAGKTTTVRMLTGQSRPHGGRALLLGLDVARETAAVQAQIGVCFEVANLYEQMSAIENLALFGKLYGVRDLDVDALLRRVGLDGRGRDRVAGYSKGMKQRLMVARALAHRPRILFLDEPTEGLDPVSAEAIRNLVLEERARGVTVFLTTHDMLEADRICDRVAFINQGRIAALDTPHSLKQRYGARVIEAQVQGAGGALETRQIVLDKPETPEAVQALFSQEQVVTIHSREASLEDIFIRTTGRGLA